MPRTIKPITLGFVAVDIDRDGEDAVVARVTVNVELEGPPYSRVISKRDLRAALIAQLDDMDIARDVGLYLDSESR